MQQLNDQIQAENSAAAEATVAAAGSVVKVTHVDEWVLSA